MGDVNNPIPARLTEAQSQFIKESVSEKQQAEPVQDVESSVHIASDSLEQIAADFRTNLKLIDDNQRQTLAHQLESHFSSYEEQPLHF